MNNTHNAAYKIVSDGYITQVIDCATGKPMKNVVSVTWTAPPPHELPTATVVLLDVAIDADVAHEHTSFVSEKQ